MYSLKIYAMCPGEAGDQPLEKTVILRPTQTKSEWLLTWAGVR
jgi:hypothetical protein